MTTQRNGRQRKKRGAWESAATSFGEVLDLAPEAGAGWGGGAASGGGQVRWHIIGNARIETVAKSWSCMVSKVGGFEQGFSVFQLVCGYEYTVVVARELLWRTLPGVRLKITRHARTHCVGKSQSCMFLRRMA